MTAEVKLRSLASVDATMQTRFGTSPFRWFDIQLDQERIANTCVRVRRISTLRFYVQAGIQPLSQPLFQFDVMDLNPETARAALKDIIAFLLTVDLSSNAQFGSPVTTPKHFPSFVLNTRAGMEPVPDPPIYTESADVRFWCLEE